MIPITTYDFSFKVTPYEGKKLYRSRYFRYYYYDMDYEVNYDGTVTILWPESIPYNIGRLEKYLKCYQTDITEKSDIAKKLCQEAKHNIPLTMEDVEVLRNKAKQIIPERAEYYAGIMNTSFSKITIRCQTSIWGSCNCDTRALSFNAALMLLPDEVIDLIVCHELAHTFVYYHSPEFWQIVEKYYPDYQKWEDWLGRYGWWYILIYPEEIRQHRLSKARKKERQK